MMSRPRVIVLLLTLVALLPYLPVTYDDFLNYDDSDYVTQNQAGQKDDAALMQERLQLYKKSRPYRESFQK